MKSLHEWRGQEGLLGCVYLSHVGNDGVNANLSLPLP